MSTHYTEKPRFEHVITGATLVIAARILEESREEVGQNGYTRTSYRVEVEEVFKGQPVSRTIEVRVTQGGEVKNLAEPTLDWKKGQRGVLVLAPDYGPGRPANSYVPYFGAAYRVTSKNEVELAGDAAAKMEPVQGRAIVKLAELRAMVEEVSKTNDAERFALSQVEPRELMEAPYPEIQEAPQREGGAARPAAPEESPGENLPPKQS